MKRFILEIFEHLSRHRLRTILTGFAVGWGVLLLIFLLGIGSSFESGLRASSRNFNVADLRLYSGFTTKPYAGFDKGRFITFDDIDIALIMQIAPAIKGVYKTLVFGGEELRTKNTYYSNWFNLVAVHPAMFRSNIVLSLKEGRLLNEEDYARASHHYVIPDDIATALFPNDTNVVGRHIIINGILGTVVGVYKRTPYESSSVYLPFSEFALRNPLVARSDAELALDLGDKVLTEAEATRLEQTLRNALAKRKQFDPTDKNAVSLNTWNLTDAKELDNFFGGLRIFLWIVGLSILAIGIVGVSNIMLVAVSERRREIGIRKALGAQSRHLVGMVLGESVIITLIAGLIGLVVGIAVLLVLDYAIVQWGVGNYTIFGETIHLLGQATISVDLGVAAIGVMLVAGLIAGYRPARRATIIPAVVAMSDKTD